jgi:tRNA A-37 threonylcarbamoyl transferase component Bud32
MDTLRICKQCRQPLPENAPEGLCPSCLAKIALGSEPAAPKTRIAPDPAELTPHFPQLEILELLGMGGMGMVYKARQPRLDRIVALKILPMDSAPHPSFAERFNREAKALAKLNHPGIVNIYDFGQAGQYYYFVMEYVDGMNLRQLLNNQPVNSRQALELVVQICTALQYAHDEGVVHRDIKPENILITRKGQVKIADFGLAKLLGAAPDTALTMSKAAMGTLNYMAPEQRENAQGVDHRADIYSLGVVFYEMLTGEVPMGRFEAPSKRVQVDVRLDEVVLRALEREPDRRYQHVSEIKTGVETITSTTPTAPVTPLAPPTRGGRESMAPGHTRPTTNTESSFSRTAIVGACFVPLSIIAAIAILAMAPPSIPTGAVALWQQEFRMGFGGVGLAAAFVTTILGWLAVGQIRQSAGTIHGTWLALFDGLLFPLLALDYGICFFVFQCGIALHFWTQDYDSTASAILIISSLVAWPVVDWLIIRAVWRAANKKGGNP